MARRTKRKRVGLADFMPENLITAIEKAAEKRLKEARAILDRNVREVLKKIVPTKKEYEGLMSRVEVLERRVGELEVMAKATAPRRRREIRVKQRRK